MSETELMRRKIYKMKSWTAVTPVSFSSLKKKTTIISPFHLIIFVVCATYWKHWVYSLEDHQNYRNVFLFTEYEIKR